MHGGIRQATLEQAIHIRFMNQTHPLLTAADFAAQAQARQDSKHIEGTAARSAVATQHKTGSQDDGSLRRQYARLRILRQKANDLRRLKQAGRLFYVQGDRPQGGRCFVAPHAAAARI